MSEEMDPDLERKIKAEGCHDRLTSLRPINMPIQQMEEHKEYKVKLTAQEIFELKDHHRELMEDTFTYEGALVLGVVDQILKQDKE